MAVKQEVANWEIQTWSSIKDTYTPFDGEIVYFESVITGQLNIVSVIGDGSSLVSALHFLNVLEISSSSNVDIQTLRVSGNRIKVSNSGSSTIEIETGVTATSKTYYLLAGKTVDLFFNGTSWIYDQENTITMPDADLTLSSVIDDNAGPARVIMPSSGITAHRTVTLLTLADNQNQVIRFDNMNTSYQLIIDGEGAETIENAFTTINLSTEYSILEGTASTWKRIGYSPIRPIYQIEDRESSGTSGGTATTGSWQTVEIDNEVITDIIGASLSSNQFTLPTGRYRIKSLNEIYYTQETGGRIYNITDSAIEIISLNGYSNAGTNIGFIDIDDEIIITESKTFELQTSVRRTQAANGYGIAVGPFTGGVDHEKYARVIIEKLI